MDDKSSPQSSSPNSMSLGLALGLYFSPVSNFTASSFACCRSLRWKCAFWLVLGYPSVLRVSSFNPF
eukprot:5891038-Prorocentrum_lima.AAC.1